MRRRPEKNGRDERARADRAHQNRASYSAADVDEKNSEDRAKHGNSAQDKWITDGSRISGERERSHENRADQADRVSFENVRGHAGAIAHVIADVVRDRGRIPRIIFFEIALDFAHEIGAHVGGFRVNTATESREDADETRTEREAHQTFYRVILGEPTGQGVEAANREQSKTHYEQTGDGSGVDSNAHRSRAGLRGGL